jgi:hypothetical protein
VRSNFVARFGTALKRHLYAESVLAKHEEGRPYAHAVKHLKHAIHRRLKVGIRSTGRNSHPAMPVLNIERQQMRLSPNFSPGTYL